MNGWSGRDFESFADLVADEHLKKNDSLKNCIATQGTLKAALQEMKEDINITSYSQKESDFQQRERQQKESLRANLISQWIHRKQITKNWGTTGISTSETISPSVTQENLNVIWHNAYPREEPLEFPQDTKKTTSQYIIENAALFGVAGALLVDSRGMNLGAAVGGMVGLFLGLQENGLNNCNIQ